MKFKDLNAISDNQYDAYLILEMTQEELESEIIRLFKEEKKYNKNKTSLYLKVHQAIQQIDLIRADFVAEGSKELRKLYFNSLAQKETPKKEKEKPIKTVNPSMSFFKHSLNNYHFNEPKFKTIQNINSFLQNILNNEEIVVTDGKYLQVLNKQNYKIKWLEQQINNQIKYLLKSQPIDNHEVLSAIEALYFLNRISPSFLIRCNKKTRHQLEACIDLIQKDETLKNQLIKTFNETARIINNALFGEYALIDVNTYKSTDKNWFINVITDSGTHPVVEIKTRDDELKSQFLTIMVFNELFKLDLDGAQLKGQGYIPLINDFSKTEDDYEAFIRQTVNINFEIKLRTLSSIYQKISQKLEFANQGHKGIQEALSQNQTYHLYKKLQKIEIELNSLRSIPISESCFQTMLEHRSSLAKKLEYKLNQGQENGREPVYFNKINLGWEQLASSHLIPKCVWYIQFHLKKINYSIEYTQKKHTILNYQLQHLDISNFTNLEQSIDQLKVLKEELIKHQENSDTWAGERIMRESVVKLIQFCQLLNIDVDLELFDQGNLIDIHAALEKVLIYPGFEQLHADMTHEDPTDLETTMSFWPAEWRQRYEEDLEQLNNLSP